MKTHENSFEVKSSRGDTLRARFVRPSGDADQSPLVIMLTGDGPKGSKSMSWVNMPPRLAQHGIASLLFDFTGLGYSDGERRTLTLSQGIADFKVVYQALHQFTWINKQRVGIMASSFGACAALACPTIMNECRVLGLKSPCCFLPDAYLGEIGVPRWIDWVRTGFCEENGYDISVFFDAFKYNVYQDAKAITSRCLITHGSADEVVPFAQSLYLKEFLSGESELIVFDNGDHGYTGDNWEKMADIFEKFFMTELRD